MYNNTVRVVTTKACDVYEDSNWACMLFFLPVFLSFFFLSLSLCIRIML